MLPPQPRFLISHRSYRRHNPLVPSPGLVHLAHGGTDKRVTLSEQLRIALQHALRSPQTEDKCGQGLIRHGFDSQDARVVVRHQIETRDHKDIRPYNKAVLSRGRFERIGGRGQVRLCCHGRLCMAACRMHLREGPVQLTLAVLLWLPCCSRTEAPQPDPSASLRSSAPIAAQPPRVHLNPSPLPDAGTSSIREVAARIDEDLPVHALSEPSEQDVFKTAPYRVDYFNDDGQGRIKGSYWVQRIWIDLNRNGQWDEKWDRKMVRGKVTCTRRVAPLDDERYTEQYVDEGETGSWKRIR
jgi:hypothetical protein